MGGFCASEQNVNINENKTEMNRILNDHDQSNKHESNNQGNTHNKNSDDNTYEKRTIQKNKLGIIF